MSVVAAPNPLRAHASEIALAAFVVGIVGMMIVPLPTPLLDVLLASNIGIAVIVLLAALRVRDGLSFVSFPALLLITTLFRLGLNVSSTRLILLQADAGAVIYSFGEFVVRGNYVVGAVVFLVLTIIQFVVIAKGAERVAEVGARFALDAMPGKQMSIDADLRAGALTQDEARSRRRDLERESQFYGAMDGAMKFVKGDAIAGIVITVVNIAGGLAIGVVMRDMSMTQALRTYGLLTIGDGLVTQIPALVLSTAAGIVVTRVASDESRRGLGADLFSDVFGSPAAIRGGAVLLLVLSLVPGLPTVPFLALAVLLGLIGWRSKLPASVAKLAPIAPEKTERTDDELGFVPVVVPISVHLGTGLSSIEAALVNEALGAARDSIFDRRGVVIPNATVRVEPSLAANAYVISLHEIPLVEGTARVDDLVALVPPAELPSGTTARPAVDPITQRAVSLVSPDAALQLRGKGITIVGPAQMIARHLEAAVAERLHELLGIDETQKLVDALERAHPALVRHAIPKPVSVSLLADVLRRLVEERVSIRGLREIVEAMVSVAGAEKDPVVLTELVRAAMRRAVTHNVARGGTVYALTLEPEIEAAIRDAIQRTASGTYLALPPTLAREIIASISQAAAEDPAPTAILTQAEVRRFVRRLLELDLPSLPVISYAELDPAVAVASAGRAHL